MAKNKKISHIIDSSQKITTQENSYTIPPWAQEQWLWLYRYISLACLAAAIFIRVFLPNSPYIIAENSILWLFLSLSFLFAFLDALEKPKWNYLKPQILLAVAGIAVIPLISSLWAADALAARNQGLVWLFDILLFLTLCYWGREKKTYQQLLAFLMSIVMLELIYCAYQGLLGLPLSRFLVTNSPQSIENLNLSGQVLKWFHIRLNIQHLFGHFILTNALAGYLILYLPFILLWTREVYKYDGTKKQKIYTNLWMLFLCLLGLTILVCTRSRGGFLSFGIIATIYTFIRLSQWNAKITLIFVLIFLCISICFTLLIYYTNIFNELGSDSLSLVMRIGYWNSCWNIFQEYPILGIGSANYPNYFYTYKEIWVEEANAAHNCLFQWIVETGLVGFIALLFLCYAILKFYYNSKKENINTTNLPIEHFKDKMSSNSKLFRFLAIVSSLSIIYLATLKQSFEYDSIEFWLQTQYPQFPSFILSLLPYIILAIIILLWLVIFAIFSSMPKPSMKLIQTGFGFGLLAYYLHNLLDMNAYFPALSQNSWVVLGFWVTSFFLEKNTSDDIESQQESHLETNSTRYHIAYNLRYFGFFVAIIFTLWIGIYEVPNQIEISALRTFFNKTSTQNNQAEYEENIARILDYKGKDSILSSHYTFFQLNSLKNLILNNPSKKIPKHVLQKAIDEFISPLESSLAYNNRSTKVLFDLATFHYEISLIYGKLEYKEKQIESLKQAEMRINQTLELYPDKAKFWWLAAQIACQQKNYELARTLYYRTLFTSNWEIFITDSERQKLQEEILSLPKK